jgi:hypothetical protein
LVGDDNEGLDKEVQELAGTVDPSKCQRIELAGKINKYGYYSGHDNWWNARMAGTIGSGNSNEQDFSNLLYKTDCCFEKGCCGSGGLTKVKVKCKVQVTLRDLYGFHYNSEVAKKGTNYWTVVHWFQGYEQEFTVPCR